MDYVSHSQLSTYGSCRQKWYYGYVEKIKPKKTSSNFYFGTLFHLGLEMYYANVRDGVLDNIYILDEIAKRHNYEVAKLSLHDFETKEQYEQIYTDVVSLVEWYIKRQDVAPFTNTFREQNAPRFPEGFKVLGLEYSKQVSHANLKVPLFGRFDMVIEDPTTGHLYIVDHKTTKNVSEDMATYYMDQAYFYMAMAAHITDDVIDPRRIKGVIFNCIKKSLPKQPKKSADGKKWNSVISNSGKPEAKGSLSTDLVELLDFMDDNPDCYEYFMNDDETRTEILTIYSDVKKQHNMGFYVPFNHEKVSKYTKYINGATQDMEQTNFSTRNISKMACGMCSYMDVCHVEHIDFDVTEANRIKREKFQLRDPSEYLDVVEEEYDSSLPD